MVRAVIAAPSLQPRYNTTIALLWLASSWFPNHGPLCSESPAVPKNLMLTKEMPDDELACRMSGSPCRLDHGLPVIIHSPMLQPVARAVGFQEDVAGAKIRWLGVADASQIDDRNATALAFTWPVDMPHTHQVSVAVGHERPKFAVI